MSDKNYGGVNVEAARALAEIVAEKNLGEITVTAGNCTITVKGKKCPPPMGGMAPMMTAPVQPAVSAPAAAPAESKKEVPQGKVIKAPIVGTFYAAPAPDQPPFVQVGDTVKKGDVVMIIESMKLMNEVTSDLDGVVQEILVQNGEAVEYDQPLMILS